MAKYLNNINNLAGGLGFEPRQPESESGVLPLDDPPPNQVDSRISGLPPRLQAFRQLFLSQDKWLGDTICNVKNSPPSLPDRAKLQILKFTLILIATNPRSY
jgi:hypothetical protein